MAKKGKSRKLIFKIDGICLWAELRQYVVTFKNVTHYCIDLEEALGSMIELMERQHLSKALWGSTRALLKEVEEVHKKFWKEVGKTKIQKG